MKTIKKLNYIFNREQKIKIAILSVMIIIGALFELLGITAILPFINVAVNPDSVYSISYLNYFYNLLNILVKWAIISILSSA